MNTQDETKFDEALMARARELAGDVQPQRDLWPAVDAAIAHASAGTSGAGRDWRRLLAQAAAVVALVGGSSAVTWLAVKDDTTNLSPVAATNESSLKAVTASFGGWEAIDPVAQVARRDVELRLAERLEQLPASTRLDVTANLQTIRSAIADINAALASEPDNALLQQLLLSSYSQELALMRRVNDIGGPMLREDI